MIYNEHQPIFPLDHIVDSIWEFSGLESNQTMKILPDGCSDIIINLSDTPSIFVSGIMTKFEENTFTSKTNLIGIRFKEGQIGRLTSFPISETKNTQLDAQFLFPSFTKTLCAQLNESNNFKDKKNKIETILLQNLKNITLPTNQLINSVIHYILHSTHKINFKTLAKNHFISLRQLERKFKYQVGVTMKEFQRIIRFKKVHQKILQSKNLNFSQIAQQFGYYDYSHLSNEFKKFSGQSISSFK